MQLEALEELIAQAESELVDPRRLLAALRDAHEKLAYVAGMGLRFGIMKTSDRPDGFLAHIWDEASDHERMFREWADSIGWEIQVEKLKKQLDVKRKRWDALILQLCDECATKASAVCRAITVESAAPIVTVPKPELKPIKKRPLGPWSLVPLEDTPEDVKGLLTKMARGVDWGATRQLRWRSAEGRFILISRAGHETWDGLGSTRYAESEHILYDLQKSTNATHGHNIHTDLRVKSWEGRLTKEIKDEILAIVEDLQQSEEKSV